MNKTQIMGILLLSGFMQMHGMEVTQKILVKNETPLLITCCHSLQRGNRITEFMKPIDSHSEELYLIGFEDLTEDNVARIVFGVGEHCWRRRPRVYCCADSVPYNAHDDFEIILKPSNSPEYIECRLQLLEKPRGALTKGIPT